MMPPRALVAGDLRAVLITGALLLAPIAACSGDDAGSTDGGAPGTGADAAIGPASDGSTPSHDGAVADAASTKDSASPDAEVDPCLGRAICDSFEATADGAPPAAPWTLPGNTGTAVVSTTRAFRGTHSLKLTTSMATYQRAMITAQGAPLFPLAQDIVYGRAMMWLENAAAHNVHWNMISAGGPVPGHGTVTASYNYGGQLDTYLANYDTNGASTDCYQHSKSSMPTGKWVCFAWKFDGTKNDMHLSTTGGEITDMHVANMGEGCIAHDFGDVWIAPTFQKASVGWESVQQDAGHTMYLDDVILDSKPIACP